MSEFCMPSLGADMQFGTVVSWRVKPGDVVKRGDVVALVETEKGVVEVEIFDKGVVEAIVIPPGQKVPVGTTLAQADSSVYGLRSQAFLPRLARDAVANHSKP